MTLLRFVGQREEAPRGVETLEHVLASVLERKVGTADEFPDRVRDEHVAITRGTGVTITVGTAPTARALSTTVLMINW